MIYNVYLKYCVAMYHAAKLRLLIVITKYFYEIFTYYRMVAFIYFGIDL